MRIAIGGIMHESNTFNAALTDRAAFGIPNLCVGKAILDKWRQSHHEIGGFIEGAETYGYELYPTLMAGATPAGPVTDDALNELVSELIERLKAAPQLDGLLLALHGAMVVQSFPDGDGEVLRRLREVLGDDFPIITTLDHHTNVSELMAEKATGLVIYKTVPHVDQRQRGLQAAEIIAHVISGKARPTQALCKPPMIFNILHQNTNSDPMHSIVESARQLEKNPKVLAANIAAGYPYADVHEMGPSAVVVTDNDPDLARAEAQRLSDMIWNVHEQLVVDLPDAAGAVRLAIQSDPRPVVLVEMGDNIGGGSPGDSTAILGELLRQGADGFVVVLYDPGAVQECIRAGVRQEVELTVGGKTDNMHGEPVKIKGSVRCIHDGLYEETEVRHGGQRYHDQGVTAVVEATKSSASGDAEAPNLLALTSKREPPFSLQQIISLGINPERQKILVVKAAIAYRAAYESIAGRIIEVDTPGITGVNPARFDYRNVRRPLWPLD